MRQNFKVNKDKKRFEDGVTIVFENGASLSIQSSPSHNCTAGQNVEIHAWGPKGERVPLKDGNDEVGWVRMDELPDFMQTVKNWKKEEEKPAEEGLYFYTMNLVSKDLPRQFIKIVVDAKPGTSAWDDLLRADSIKDKATDITYSRKDWGW